MTRALASSPGKTGARESLESHLLAFAAESSRVGAGLVTLEDYRRRAWLQV